MPTTSISFINKIESLALRGAAIASTVSGAIAAAAHVLPVAVASVLVAAGPTVYLVERYWAKVKKAL